MGQGVVEPNIELIKLGENFQGRPVYRWLNPSESLEPQNVSLLTNRWKNVDRHPLIVAEVASRQVPLIESLVRIGFRPTCSTLTLVLNGQHAPIYRALAGYRVRPGDLLDRQRWGELVFPERSLAYESVDRSAYSEHSRNALCDSPDWIARPLLVAEDVEHLRSVAMVVIDRPGSSVARLEAIFERNAKWSVVALLIQETVRWLQEEDTGGETMVMECDLRHWELIGLVLKQGFVARQTRTYLHWSDLPTPATSPTSTSSVAGCVNRDC